MRGVLAVVVGCISTLTGSVLAGAWDGDGATDDAAHVEIAAPSVNPRTGVRWHRDMHYAGEEETNPEKQVLDLYLPREDNWLEGKPLVIWIHGGGWIMGDKDDAFGLYGRYCRKLAERGIAAANVGYRLSPEVRHPSHIEDIAAATAWLLARAEELGFDPEHVFVSGHSAGGHLAALLAVDDRWLLAEGADPASIIGVIPSSGVYDLKPMFEGRYAFGGAFPDGTAQDASPVAHVDATDPPFLIMVETYGRYMRDQMESMASALADASVEHEVVELPHSNHVTMLSDLAKDDGISLTKSVEFITRVLDELAEESKPSEGEAAATPAGGG